MNDGRVYVIKARGQEWRQRSLSVFASWGSRRRPEKANELRLSLSASVCISRTPPWANNCISNKIQKINKQWSHVITRHAGGIWGGVIEGGTTWTFLPLSFKKDVCDILKCKLCIKLVNELHRTAALTTLQSKHSWVFYIRMAVAQEEAQSSANRKDGGLIPGCEVPLSKTLNPTLIPLSSSVSACVW